MQYIILDLEWNQPINFQNRTYQLYGDRLTFELIQIGAVRVSGDFTICDSISIPIEPTCYTVIHPRVRTMTHLSAEYLAGCPRFQEAIESFAQWCGSDYILLTWGCDDINVLKQNMDFFDVHPDFPTLYDIQPLFSREYKLTNRMGLQSAVELMQLQEDSDRYFHNALHDAYYTAQVFTHLKNPAAVTDFPQTARALIPHAAVHRTDTFATIEEALESDMAKSPACMMCGKKAAIDSRYIPQSHDKFIALAKCSRHGELLVRASLRKARDGSYALTMKAAKASRSNIAYIHTKQLQISEREAAGETHIPPVSGALLS